jgi:hypothetical protein
MSYNLFMSWLKNRFSGAALLPLLRQAIGPENKMNDSSDRRRRSRGVGRNIVDGEPTLDDAFRVASGRYEVLTSVQLACPHMEGRMRTPMCDIYDALLDERLKNLDGAAALAAFDRITKMTNALLERIALDASRDMLTTSRRRLMDAHTANRIRANEFSDIMNELSRLATSVADLSRKRKPADYCQEALSTLDCALAIHKRINKIGTTKVGDTSHW